MCGRYVFNQPGAILDETLESLDGFELSGRLPALEPRFNVAPTQEMPILHRAPCNLEDRDQTATKRIVISIARWSFSGPGQQPRAASRPLINARSETIREKPSFSQSFQSSRCLVPASGFYEWRSNGNRQPFFFHRPGYRGFCFAGLCQLTHGTAQEPNESNREYCIITGSAGPSMAEVHHRRPIILSPAIYSRWLDPAVEEEELLDLLDHSDPPLEQHPVSYRVNKVGMDEARLLDPVPEAPINLSLF